VTTFRASIIILLTTLFGFASCSSTAPDPVPNRGLRVLFIGNSLTSTNNLPGMVEQLAAAEGETAVSTESVVFGGYSLEDHWQRGDALRAIDKGGWDVVVLQQGPSALPESRALLVQYAQMFAEKIRAVGARPAMYSVWPELSRDQAWDSVTASYADAARAVNGFLLPAGEALREALRRDPSLQLFEGDGFHPSALGSYLAALVMFSRLTEHTPAGMAPLAPPMPLNSSTAQVLEASAASALEKFPE
jgi:hypothetical protein